MHRYYRVKRVYSTSSREVQTQFGRYVVSVEATLLVPDFATPWYVLELSTLQCDFGEHRELYLVPRLSVENFLPTLFRSNSRRQVYVETVVRAIMAELIDELPDVQRGYSPKRIADLCHWGRVLSSAKGLAEAAYPGRRSRVDSMIRAMARSLLRSMYRDKYGGYHLFEPIIDLFSPHGISALYEAGVLSVLSKGKGADGQTAAESSTVAIATKSPLRVGEHELRCYSEHDEGRTVDIACPIHCQSSVLPPRGSLEEQVAYALSGPSLLLYSTKIAEDLRHKDEKTRIEQIFYDLYSMVIAPSVYQTRANKLKHRIKHFLTLPVWDFDDLPFAVRLGGQSSHIGPTRWGRESTLSAFFVTGMLLYRGYASHSYSGKAVCADIPGKARYSVDKAKVEVTPCLDVTEVGEEREEAIYSKLDSAWRLVVVPKKENSLHRAIRDCHPFAVTIPDSLGMRVFIRKKINIGEDGSYQLQWVEVGRLRIDRLSAGRLASLPCSSQDRDTRIVVGIPVILFPWRSFTEDSPFRVGEWLAAKTRMNIGIMGTTLLPEFMDRVGQANRAIELADGTLFFLSSLSSVCRTRSRVQPLPMDRAAYVPQERLGPVQPVAEILRLRRGTKAALSEAISRVAHTWKETDRRIRLSIAVAE